MLIDRLRRHSGLSKSQLLYLSATASRRYKVYEIAKRNGGKRTIAHPSKSLKAIQRWINQALFDCLPVHKCATAYKKGASIRRNAAVHGDTCFTLRMDFADFFPSFTLNGVVRFVEHKNVEMSLGLSSKDIQFVGRIVSREGFLTIGAPSSPTITNAMMYDFDERVFSFVRRTGLVYTRYADDLFISSRKPNQLGTVCSFVHTASKDFAHAKLRINREKTAFLSRRYRRAVTGLVITPDGKVSIGRNRKREIKALIHKYFENAIQVEDVGRTRGLIAFSMDSDPEFYKALCKKYGMANLKRIMSDR